MRASCTEQWESCTTAANLLLSNLLLIRSFTWSAITGENSTERKHSKQQLNNPLPLDDIWDFAKLNRRPAKLLFQYTPYVYISCKHFNHDNPAPSSTVMNAILMQQQQQRKAPNPNHTIFKNDSFCSSATDTLHLRYKPNSTSWQPLVMASAQRKPGGHRLSLTVPPALQLPPYSTQKPYSPAEQSHHALLQRARYSFPNSSCTSQTPQGPIWQPHSSVLQAWPRGTLVQGHHGKPHVPHAHRHRAGISASHGGTTVLQELSDLQPWWVCHGHTGSNRSN